MCQSNQTGTRLRGKVLGGTGHPLRLLRVLRAQLDSEYRTCTQLVRIVPTQSLGNTWDFLVCLVHDVTTALFSWPSVPE